jgi:hypothetical protein
MRLHDLPLAHRTTGRVARPVVRQERQNPMHLYDRPSAHHTAGHAP